MYANWQGNFIDISSHFIPPQQIDKLCLNELDRRKIGFIGTDSQGSRVYSIHGKSIALGASHGNQSGLYLFGCVSPNKLKLNQNGRRFSTGEKFYTLTTIDRHGIFENATIRRLNPIECERLQTLSDQYTAGVSDTQRYKAIGNGWTVDVIAHLLSYLK